MQRRMAAPVAADAVDLPPPRSAAADLPPRIAADEEDEELRQGGGGRTMIKTFTAAVLLFLVGSLMLAFGVPALAVDWDRGVAMVVVGTIAFLPGFYACWVFLGAWLRWRGYSYDDIPSYDD